MSTVPSAASSSSSSVSSSAYLRQLLNIESSSWEDKVFGHSPLHSEHDPHNLPPSKDYFVNTRGQRILYRLTWPSGVDVSHVKGVIVFMHGYAAHTNRPIHRYLAQKFTSHHYAYVTFDFHSHGYSDGEAHALVNSVEDLVNDCLQMLLVLYGAGSEAGIGQLQCSHNAMWTSPTPPTHTDTSPDDVPHTATPVLTHPLPFYLVGHSMGGGVSLLAANIIQQTPSHAAFHTEYSLQYQQVITSLLTKHFAGVMLLCPLVEILNNSKFPPLPTPAQEEVRQEGNFCNPPVLLATPPATSTATPTNSWQDYLRDNTIDFLAFWYPRNTIPDIFIDDNKMNEQIWAYPLYRAYIENDPLSYHGNIRFITLKTMLEISNQVQRVIPQVDFPFLVLHDSRDAVVSVNGINNLLAHCKSVQKVYIEVPGGLHDILANRIEFSCDTMVQWLKELQTESGMMTMMSAVDSAVF